MPSTSNTEDAENTEITEDPERGHAPAKGLCCQMLWRFGRKRLSCALTAALRMRNHGQVGARSGVKWEVAVDLTGWLDLGRARR